MKGRNDMALRSNAVAALLILCGCAILVGCSNKDRLYDVSGTVTVAGEPIPQGTITFTPVDGVGRDFLTIEENLNGKADRLAMALKRTGQQAYAGQMLFALDADDIDVIDRRLE